MHRTMTRDSIASASRPPTALPAMTGVGTVLLLDGRAVLVLTPELEDVLDDGWFARQEVSVPFRMKKSWLCFMKDVQIPPTPPAAFPASVGVTRIRYHPCGRLTGFHVKVCRVVASIAVAKDSMRPATGVVEPGAAETVPLAYTDPEAMEGSIVSRRNTVPSVNVFVWDALLDATTGGESWVTLTFVTESV